MPCGSGGAGRAAAARGAAGGLRRRFYPGLRLAGPGGAGRAGETGGGRFTAGEVTIQEGDGAARAAALRLQAETVLGPWLADRGFAFQGVPG